MKEVISECIRQQVPMRASDATPCYLVYNEMKPLTFMWGSRKPVRQEDIKTSSLRNKKKEKENSHTCNLPETRESLLLDGLEASRTENERRLRNSYVEEVITSYVVDGRCVWSGRWPGRPRKYF